MANRALDIKGQRFGRLIAVEPLPEIKTEDRKIVWLFRCDCGNYIRRKASDVKRGFNLSCGCLFQEVYPKANLKHGMTKTSLYSIWQGMRDRCANPNNKGFKYYGGRSIKVCDRWLGEHGFENFLADMGERPGKEYSIDRIDVNGDYCPENCRWATASMQANNRNSSHFVEFNGETYTVAELSRMLKIDRTTLSKRLSGNLPMEDVFSKRDLRENKRGLTDSEVLFIRTSGLKYKRCKEALGKDITEGAFYAARRGRTYKNIKIE